MKFHWDDGQTYCRCTITPKVQVRTYSWGGGEEPVWISSVGFMRIRYVIETCTTRYEGHIYGTVSKEPPRSFPTMEEAKTYVEEQSLIGLTVKRLGM